jgi:hypothetical protein
MAYPNQGAAANTVSSAPRSNSVANAMEDFDPCIERAAKCAANLRGLCDRLTGPRPTAVGKEIGDGSIPQSILASIHGRRSQLAAILDDMEEALQHLDAAI